MAKADPLKSEGARLARKSVMAKLKRDRKKQNHPVLGRVDSSVANYIDGLIKWLGAAQKRYDSREGGLGKK